MAVSCVVERVHLSADKLTSRSGSTGIRSLPALTGTAAGPTNRQDDIAFLIVEGMMTANMKSPRQAFAEFLLSASVGDEHVYHRGYLARDRDPCEGGPRSYQVDLLASAVLQASDDGVVQIMQRRIGKLPVRVRGPPHQPPMATAPVISRRGCGRGASGLATVRRLTGGDVKGKYVRARFMKRLSLAAA